VSAGAGGQPICRYGFTCTRVQPYLGSVSVICFRLVHNPCNSTVLLCLGIWNLKSKERKEKSRIAICHGMKVQADHENAISVSTTVDTLIEDRSTNRYGILKSVCRTAKIDSL
jgi:hypothetical protein